MSSRILHVPAQVYGRCLLSLPEQTETPRVLLVGFHGYGDRAESSLEALERIRENRPWALAAVQALHPFYRRSDGEVVASWMTRLDRELAITDNRLYVARAIERLRDELSSVRAMAFVGFSQGVAMAYRAAASSPFPVSALVCLAGDVPPELEHEDRELPPVLLGRGRDDDWYDATKLAEDRRILGSLGVEYEILVFDGGHEWAEAFLRRAHRFLIEKLADESSQSSS